MKRRDFIKFSAIGLGATTIPVFASGGHGEVVASSGELQAVAKKMYTEIINNNDFYAKQKGDGFFKNFTISQSPRATIVGCSDSRFQESVLDSTPENDLFVIRNIGNQYTSNEGSVGYGVMHLHTPLLIIVGHTRCGAIKAALSDYTSEDSPIRKEVDTLSLSIRKAHLVGDNIEQWAAAVEANVNQQVEYCLSKFSEQVKSGQLTIVGVIYDLANDLSKGAGKIHTVNINGETNKKTLENHPLIK